MAAIKTIVSVPSQDARYELPGEWNAQGVRNSYAADLPYLSNMTETLSRTTTEQGEVLTITFAPRTGNKG